MIVEMIVSIAALVILPSLLGLALLVAIFLVLDFVFRDLP